MLTVNFEEKYFILFISSLCFTHLEKHVQKQLCNCNFKLNLEFYFILVLSKSAAFDLVLLVHGSFHGYFRCQTKVKWKIC